MCVKNKFNTLTSPLILCKKFDIIYEQIGDKIEIESFTEISVAHQMAEGRGEMAPRCFRTIFVVFDTH